MFLYAVVALLAVEAGVLLNEGSRTKPKKYL
jgi:hypothetical protein